MSPNNTREREVSAKVSRDIFFKKIDHFLVLLPVSKTWFFEKFKYHVTHGRGGGGRTMSPNDPRGGEILLIILQEEKLGEMFVFLCPTFTF